MKLLICLITYNRLAYTQRTLESLKKTIDVPHHLVVVDNGSTDGTALWLADNVPNFTINDTNRYPGAACNQGWVNGLREYPKATHLMRCDNDMEFTENWATKAEEYFEAIPPLGQLGLDHTALDTYNGDPRYLTTMNGKTVNAWPGNVGGPCIIRREVYDKGLRYDETPWQDLRKDKDSMITPQEDVKFSLSMHNYGLIYGHPTEKLAWTFADESNRDEYPEYYKQTFKERGYDL